MSGGSSETALKELAVKPTTSPSSALAVMIVIPVAKQPSASRNALESMTIARLSSPPKAREI